MARPLWADWASAIAAGFGIVLVCETAYSLYTGSSATEAMTGAIGGALVALQLSMPMSLVGVWLARSMGWRKAWITGAIFGVLGYAILLVWWATRH
ncbi:MAG: hypothetical protein Q7V14_04245 [Coriobacteriia bacterium]|nr:hypothetical protein [Coriobacteriia bacterium]MDO9107594.1 hypothetical protein [Coriobacteriia bacterium]